MKLEDVCTSLDVLNSGPFEGETFYNKAFEYGRYDICLKIAEGRREISEFGENVSMYEETGEQIYKDKATGRYYHLILWTEIISRLKVGNIDTLDSVKLKESIIDDLALPLPYYNCCYACSSRCEVCPIVKQAGRCFSDDSAYHLFTTALDEADFEEAIVQAKRIRDAWTK